MGHMLSNLQVNPFIKNIYEFGLILPVMSEISEAKFTVGLIEVKGHTSKSPVHSLSSLLLTRVYLSKKDATAKMTEEKKEIDFVDVCDL